MVVSVGIVGGKQPARGDQPVLRPIERFDLETLPTLQLFHESRQVLFLEPER